MPVETEAEFADPRWADAWPDALSDVARICEHVLEAELTDAQTQQSLELSLLLTDDAQIRQLNHAHRGKDKPTNVLSFPSAEPLDGGCFVGFGPPVMLGDIAMAFDTVEREALAAGLALRHHAAHLVIHGVLHLLGFDHVEEGDADVMEAKEIAFCRDFGIANPYQRDVKG